MRESLVVGVRAGRGTWFGAGSVDGGCAGGHPGAQLACLEAPHQLLVCAAEALLLVALLLHVHLQVGVLLRQLPGEEEEQNVNVEYYWEVLLSVLR